MTKLNELIQMRIDNPDLPVRFMLPTDTDDDHPYYSGDITNVEVDVVWNCTSKHMIFVGESYIKDELYVQTDRVLLCISEHPDEDVESEDVTEARIDAKYDEMVSSGIINKEIIVTMGFTNA